MKKSTYLTLKMYAVIAWIGIPTTAIPALANRIPNDDFPVGLALAAGVVIGLSVTLLMAKLGV